VKKYLFHAIISVLLFLGTFSYAQNTAFRIVGYVPNWINVSGFAQSFDYSKVTHLNFAFQNPDTDGNLFESNTGLSTLVTKAHQKNVKVLVSIGGGGSSATEGTVKTNFQKHISDTVKRAAFIHKIHLYLKSYNLDGIDVDEEGPAINSNYLAFVKQLTDSLRPEGLLITAAVGWGGENIPNSALKLFDWVSLMAYDYTGSWDQGNPGQHSPYWFAQSLITQYTNRGLKKEQIVLGVPFYGYGFYAAAGDYNYNQIISQFPDAYLYDKLSDTIYYNGANTIWRKTRLAMEKASGVMIWELSGDATGSKSLLSVIAATVDSFAIPGLVADLSASEFTIYPNPASTGICISNQKLPEKDFLFQILDFKGCLVKSGRMVLGKTPAIIDITNLSDGLYICRLSTREQVLSNVFIKESK
jgi:chitinase